MTYVYYQGASGRWRWRLKASNGRVIADSAEDHQNKEDCLHDINLVKQSGNATVIVEPSNFEPRGTGCRTKANA
jgi:uncharacterized protein YegP (UPF0339 family)